ncbi:unnamed protein product [Echinostoma caproni]|uniref:Trigger_N domain-containing protein n=1 Tax=Echinostoma caproni TaxID=27848 RepID=A0A183A660_9TREM|nr:unnamed protein product [Echinostoma caproni]
MLRYPVMLNQLTFVSMSFKSAVRGCHSRSDETDGSIRFSVYVDMREVDLITDHVKKCTEKSLSMLMEKWRRKISGEFQIPPGRIAIETPDALGLTKSRVFEVKINTKKNSTATDKTSRVPSFSDIYDIWQPACSEMFQLIKKVSDPLRQSILGCSNLTSEDGSLTLFIHVHEAALDFSPETFTQCNNENFNRLLNKWKLEIEKFYQLSGPDVSVSRKSLVFTVS